ncbi:MAG: hypothetical protein R8L58_03810 [Mariprofundaceae bacterium]
MKEKYIMKFDQKDKLDNFLAKINQYLTEGNNQRNVVYSHKYADSWDGDKLAVENETLLSDVSGNANVYMLFTAMKRNSDYKLRYVGKTTKKLARQRLRNHLFKKHDGTGAKLEKVKSHVKSGGSVKISWVLIEPESLRNWAEEELISSHPEADWNRENA